jgi:hypothetical protein
MAVVAWGDTITCSGFDNLAKFEFAILATSLRIAGLQKSPTAATTEVVGSIRLHVYKIFLSDHAFDDKTKILSNRISQRCSNQLTRILNSEFNPQILVPVGTDFQFTLTDPLGVVFNNALSFKVMSNIKFFQSDPDCKKFMPSLSIKPYLTAKIIHSLGLNPYNMFPVFKVGTKKTIVFCRPSFGAISPVGTHCM